MLANCQDGYLNESTEMSSIPNSALNLIPFATVEAPPKVREHATTRLEKKVVRQEHREPDPQPTEKKPKRKREAKPEPKQVLNWAAIIWLGLLHVGCLFAPFFFSWQAVVLVFALHWLTGGIGICLGFHRYLTHSSFVTYKWVRYTLAFLGGMAGEGSVIDWVANHRKHHAHSDEEGDPHSPREGGAWWSHLWWMAWQVPTYSQVAHLRRWAPDLVKDKGMRWIARLFLPSQFMLAGVLFGLGYLLGGTYMGCSFVVYGCFIRLVFVLHSTWFVNSASHIWGYKNYDISDDSRNNWWVAIIAYGEGWHNNHHAYPRMAPHGHKWWEFDMTYMAIRTLKAVGLAWDVVDYKKKSDVE